jgi:hypothetical protein
MSYIKHLRTERGHIVHYESKSVSKWDIGTHCQEKAFSAISFTKLRELKLKHDRFTYSATSEGAHPKGSTNILAPCVSPV